MKTIVTAIVILATFNGMAQENPLLPLPKYYKKNKLSNLNAIEPFLQKPQVLKRNKQNNLYTIKPHFHKKSPFLFSDSGSTKGYEIFTLKQDGMLCVAPNMRKFNNMPNAVKPADLLSLGRKPGTMPNPYLRQQRPKAKLHEPAISQQEQQNISSKE